MDRALDQVKLTGLYQQACIEWRGFNPANQDWSTFRNHFNKVYKGRLDTGIATGASGHPGAANVETDNDNNLDTVVNVNSISCMQLANNTNAQTMSDGLSMITAPHNKIHQPWATAQQQLAALVTAIDQPTVTGCVGQRLSPTQYATAATVPQRVEAPTSPPEIAPPLPPQTPPAGENRVPPLRSRSRGRGRGGYGQCAGRRSLAFAAQSPKNDAVG